MKTETPLSIGSVSSTYIGDTDPFCYHLNDKYDLTIEDFKKLTEHLRGGYQGDVEITINGANCLFSDGVEVRRTGPDYEYYWDSAGEYHRNDGPAWSVKGDVQWYQHGKLHNEEGPAVEYTDGTKRYYWKNQRVTKEDWQFRVNESRTSQVDEDKTSETSASKKEGDLIYGDLVYRNGIMSYNGWIWDVHPLDRGKVRTAIRERWSNFNFSLNDSDQRVFIHDGHLRRRVTSNATFSYNKKGNLHNHAKNTPAISWQDGRKEWYNDGLRHNDFGPAITYATGLELYYLGNVRYESKAEWKKARDRKMMAKMISENERFHWEIKTAAGFAFTLRDHQIPEELMNPKFQTPEFGKAFLQAAIDGSWVDNWLGTSVEEKLEAIKKIYDWTEEKKSVLEKSTGFMAEYFGKDLSSKKTYHGSGWVEKSEDGFYHSTTGPASVTSNQVEYFLNGKPLTYEEWKALTRPDYSGPIQIKPGTFHGVSEIIFQKNGHIHRENGPATITEDGTQKWFRDGWLHNEYGFAKVSAEERLYAIEGNTYSEENVAEWNEARSAWYKKQEEKEKSSEKIDPEAESLFHNLNEVINKIKTDDKEANVLSSNLNETMKVIEKYLKKENTKKVSKGSELGDEFYKDLEKRMLETSPLDIPKSKWVYDYDKYQQDSYYFKSISKEPDYNNFINNSYKIEKIIPTASGPNKKEKTRASVKAIADTAKQGVKVGVATEAANVAYQGVAKMLTQTLGVSEEKLKDPVNRELIMFVAMAMTHVGADVYSDKVNKNQIQDICGLIMEGKVKDNTSLLLKALPMLKNVSNKMDVDQHMLRIVEDVKEETLDVEDFEIDVDLEELSEQLDELDEMEESYARNSR